MDKGVIQASDRPQVFGYTNREHYENISAVSKERKQACTAHRSSRKAHHPNPLMNAIGQKKHSSTVLLTGTTRSFVLTWRNKDGRYHTTYKRNSMNTSNVADWSMDFYAYNAVPAIMNAWLRSAVNGVGFAPVVAPGAWLKAQPCWWTKFCRINPCVNYCHGWHVVEQCRSNCRGSACKPTSIWALFF